MARILTPLDILVCPNCQSPLYKQGDVLYCKKSSCGSIFSVKEGIFQFVKTFDEDSLQLSSDKWRTFYDETLSNDSYEDLYSNYMTNHFDSLYEQISEFKKVDKDLIFLEMGCGLMFLGRAISDKCALVIGLDISNNALKIVKKKFDALGIKNYILIQGDIGQMPIKSNSIGLVYGGGVLEHLKNTNSAVEEFYRVLKKGGVSFNTIPHLNVGSLTYRQLWGNIPDFPLVRTVFAFIHIKLLKAKHMRFGYELSFPARKMFKLHKKSGFREVFITKFEVTLSFDFVLSGSLKRILRRVANSSPLFWPMIKVIGKK